jgi:predicted peptidase
MKSNNLLIISLLATVFCIFSCKKDDMSNYNNLANLPQDTGGVHIAYPFETNEAPYGYYAYTPSVKGPQYPLLVFLHGAGEKGNSSEDNTILDLVLRNGPPKLIEKKDWNPRYPMIVVSPQCHETGWNGAKIHEFIKFIIKNYNINTNRIYVTGLSMGGFGTFAYLTTTADSCYAAAAVPICGGGNSNKVEGMKHIPVWAFHGDADGTVAPSGSINMINAINAANPPLNAKLTMYPGVGHNSWSMTYDGIGMGTESPDYDAFNMSIYDWMFQYEWKQYYTEQAN